MKMEKTKESLNQKAIRHRASLTAFEQFRSKYRQAVRCLLSKELVQMANPLPLNHSELEELLNFGKRARGERGLPRPQNQWVLYRKYKNLQIDADRFGQITKKVAVLWRQETNSVKQFFEFLAETSKRAHKLAFPDYRFRPGQNFSKRRKYMSKPKQVINFESNNNVIGNQIHQFSTTNTISESPQQTYPECWNSNEFFDLDLFNMTLNLQPQESSIPSSIPTPKIDSLPSQTSNEQVEPCQDLIVPSMQEIDRTSQALIDLQNEVILLLLANQQNWSFNPNFPGY
ncbi:1675_t:CDS:1 [Ambispora leptoticha]|uniref:1675_t:CDS:1 n=1 Tax=Ambispora leptoticha TaxID=144679 RepID=A0A9N8V8X8_9GLOM|nr:1675_t:CDS:1 [Ambispora leptoticha]